MKQIKVVVSGKVQGVWFRQSTKQVAQQYNIKGYANNLSDGSVEVYAVGSEVAIEKLVEFLNHGPERARVDNLCITTVSRPVPAQFTTG